MNDHLYDEIITEENFEEKRFKKSKYRKRKHLLKDKKQYLKNKYYEQFITPKKEVNNFSIKKIKYNITLEIFNPKTRWVDYEFMEIIGWATPSSYVRSNETILGFYHSFKKAKDSFYRKYNQNKKDDFVINKIKEKIKNSKIENVSSLGVCYKIIVRNEEILEERKVSYIKQNYIELIDTETKETENFTFYKKNLKKHWRGFFGKNLNIHFSYKKDSWDTYLNKQDMLDKINKLEFLKELKTFN